MRINIYYLQAVSEMCSDGTQELSTDVASAVQNGYLSQGTDAVTSSQCTDVSQSTDVSQDRSQMESSLSPPHTAADAATTTKSKTRDTWGRKVNRINYLAELSPVTEGLFRVHKPHTGQAGWVVVAACKYR